MNVVSGPYRHGTSGGSTTRSFFSAMLGPASWHQPTNSTRLTRVTWSITRTCSATARQRGSHPSGSFSSSASCSARIRSSASSALPARAAPAANARPDIGAIAGAEVARARRQAPPAFSIDGRLRTRPASAALRHVASTRRYAGSRPAAATTSSRAAADGARGFNRAGRNASPAGAWSPVPVQKRHTPYAEHLWPPPGPACRNTRPSVAAASRVRPYGAYPLDDSSCDCPRWNTQPQGTSANAASPPVSVVPFGAPVLGCESQYESERKASPASTKHRTWPRSRVLTVPSRSSSASPFSSVTSSSSRAPARPAMACTAVRTSA
ncbi:MAG: hypothetical protein U1E39_10680 [Planctomycetota bacterium]